VPFIEYDGARLAKIWPLTGYDINTQFLPTISDKGVLSLAEALPALLRSRRVIPDLAMALLSSISKKSPRFLFKRARPCQQVDT
jgi:hypothetical protein